MLRGRHFFQADEGREKATKKSRAAKRGCFKRGGFPIWTCPSFFVLSLRAQRLKNFKILKFSSELENFKRAAHQTPIFCGEF